MCFYPQLTLNRKYIPNKKNGGIVPAIYDERVKYVPYGCGNCMECRKQKTRNWQIRLHEDIKHNTNAKFICLTFSDQSIYELNKLIPEDINGYERDNAIATIATRRFLERFRKTHKKSLRHYLITELGHNGTENIHLHGLIWTDLPMENIEAFWKYGYIWKGKMVNGKLTNYVNNRTINYIVKYINKIDFKHPSYKSIILTSPGIGNSYTKSPNSKMNKFKNENTIEYYKSDAGYKLSLPIYYRNKLYTEHQREQLWLQRLDKQERWVGGERVDISKGEENYYKLLEYYRHVNKSLGYGDNIKNWDQIQYEKYKREILQQTRIEKAIKKQASGGVLAQDIGLRGENRPEEKQTSINNSTWIITDKGIYQKQCGKPVNKKQDKN